MSKIFEQPSPHAARMALLLALSSLGGCVAFAGGGKTDDVGADPGDGVDPSEQVSDQDQALRERCRESTEKAKAFLEDSCGSCHGSSPGQGNFDTVLSISSMIDDGKIVPGKADASPIYTAVSGGVMPPSSVTDRPSKEDVAYLRDWIGCGAPALARAADAPPFIALDERMRTMVADLRSFDQSDRTDIRYIDLYNLANAGFTEVELDEYREAVSFLVNSLSNGLRVVSPQRVDDRGLLFRIELDDYGWSQQTWATIAADYPYAVKYDDDSGLFPIDERASEQIRELTGESIPYLQADWFVSHAVRPPLYYDVLEMPSSLEELQEELGVNVAANVAAERVDRAGFRNAASSQNDRVIERHELAGGRGALWLSYDFADGVGTSNVFAHPLDFKPDGIQVAFNLKNGLQAYMIADASGQRLDEASNKVLQDPRSRSGAAEAGVSCLGCHQTQGVAARTDEVRSAFESSRPDEDARDTVRALYPLPAEMNELFEADAARYTAGRSRAVLTKLSDSAMHDINNRHLDTLDLAEVSAVLGIKVEEFQARLKAITGSNDVPAEIEALNGEGVVIPRDGFDSIFTDLVRALGLGEPFRRGEVPGDDDNNNDGDDAQEQPADGSDGEEADAGTPAEADGSDTSGDGSSNDGDGYGYGN